ncbi:MAG: exodeoxyribonuclease VII large subunit [Candidatus Moraniibacteriota bacterium]
MTLLSELRIWRDEQARVEGVEGYRVLNNAALEELARTMPTDKDTLCQVKGIKDAKYRRYGKTLLGMIASFAEGTAPTEGEKATAFFEQELRITHQASEKQGEEKIVENTTDEPLSVSQFLDSLNLELSGMAARIRGEVSSVDVRERVVYFTLKDSLDESIVSCLIFRYQYEVSGVQLTIGDEVIVEGGPDIYKPSGRLSLKVGVIEYAGEGELKKAYDALHRKLELAGAFSPERKRPIPAFAEHIAIITSREGAAIGDFTMNLTRAGLHVDFYPTLVEGKKAAFEIIEAIRYFNRMPERYDALVIIRGGGSLESLQAFNTEALVNEVVASRIPVLAGIGHERDVSLAALAADHMVSTPTATARHLSSSWDEARASLGKQVVVLERAVHEFQRSIQERVRSAEGAIRVALDTISRQSTTTQAAFREAIALFPEYCRRIAGTFEADPLRWRMHIEGLLSRLADRLNTSEERLRQYDPVRALQLGYSLVRKQGHIIRGTGDIVIGDRIDIQLGQGSIESEVTGITKLS